MFFAMKSPDKLDRIGEYLEQRLSRDVARQKYGSVIGHSWHCNYQGFEFDTWTAKFTIQR